MSQQNTRNNQDPRNNQESYQGQKRDPNRENPHHIVDPDVREPEIRDKNQDEQKIKASGSLSKPSTNEEKEKHGNKSTQTGGGNAQQQKGNQSHERDSEHKKPSEKGR
ncbi:MAG: hypothetical protein ACK4PR_10025 [Gammaproteobacteria bacterium]